MCWQHTQIKQGVSVETSTIKNAGQGLYALKDFKEGQTIAPYKGEVMTKKQLDARYPGDTLAPYAVQIGNTRRYIDARKTNSGVARYSNDARNPKKNNAKLDKNGKRVVIKATKPIKPTSMRIPGKSKRKKAKEVFTDYSGNYWK